MILILAWRANSFIIFGVIVLSDKQTDRQTNKNKNIGKSRDRDYGENIHVACPFFYFHPILGSFDMYLTL